MARKKGLELLWLRRKSLAASVVWMSGRVPSGCSCGSTGHRMFMPTSPLSSGHTLLNEYLIVEGW